MYTIQLECKLSCALKKIELFFGDFAEIKKAIRKNGVWEIHYEYVGDVKKFLHQETPPVHPELVVCNDQECRTRLTYEQLEESDLDGCSNDPC